MSHIVLVQLYIIDHVLKCNKCIESRTTVQHVTQDDLEQPGTKEHVQVFDADLMDFQTQGK